MLLWEELFNNRCWIDFEVKERIYEEPKVAGLQMCNYFLKILGDINNLRLFSSDVKSALSSG